MHKRGRPATWFSSPRGAEVISTGWRRSRARLPKSLFSSPRGAEVISTVGIESGRYSDFVVFSSPRGAEVISTLQPITSTLSFRACSRPLAGLRSFQHENVVVRIYSDYDCTFSSPRGAEVISTLWPSVRTRAIIVVLPVCHKHRFGRARYILTRGTYTRVSRPSTCSI